MKEDEKVKVGRRAPVNTFMPNTSTAVDNSGSPTEKYKIFRF
jgi:hypothetical protein